MAERAGIGVFALDTLTTGMYQDPLAVVRELVQNSCDSILEAERTGVLVPGTGEVTIDVAPAERRVLVRDNGVGISVQTARQRLLDVGKSPKDAQSAIGFRGIGRLAGIAYSERLCFTGSCVGETEAARFSFDCAGLRALMDPSSPTHDELADVLYAAHEYGTSEAGRAAHYFEVSLEGVTAEGSALLDRDHLHRYLAETAPVPYDSHRFMWASVIDEYARAHGHPLFSVNLRITSDGGDRLVFKPYRNRYRTGGNQPQELPLHNITFFPEVTTEATGFWGWYSVTDLLGAIDDPAAAGFRIRKANMALGGRDLSDQLFKETRFNAWFVGEVHLTDPACVPNARRDGLEPVGSWPTVRTSLALVAADRSAECRKLSEQRNVPAGKTVDKLRAVVQSASAKHQSGFASPAQRDEVAAQIAQAIASVHAIAPRQAQRVGSEVVANAVDEACAVLDAVRESRSFVALRTRSTLDRQKRKMLTEVLDVLRHELVTDQYERAEAALLKHFGA